MARKPARKRAPAVAEQGENKDSQALHRIAGLLAIIAVKDMDTDDAALKLDAIGFSASEVSGMLGVGTNYIQVARFRKRNAGRKIKKRKV
ncbi:hypothetical protein [Bradyrhizobium diazoefficiens]|uniref:hypothetical protein n=1 Tax=Bradyrhizobium diazoefficiens TaxID=1355477 RepID=UPI0004B4BB1C|nr:hypothetical protein [Bradyrhizobium diazoefficiens]